MVVAPLASPTPGLEGHGTAESLGSRPAIGAGVSRPVGAIAALTRPEALPLALLPWPWPQQAPQGCKTFHLLAPGLGQSNFFPAAMEPKVAQL